MSPPLTSVHVDIAELGARAVRTLLHAMSEKNAHERRHHRLATTLVIRQSCGASSTGERPPPPRA
jgi:DNA-binding LacI/PurR family transcriptional regulator